MRLGAVGAVLGSRSGIGRDVLHLARGRCRNFDTSVAARAVDDVGMQRVGRRVAVFDDARRMPFAQGDLAVVAAAGDADRAALLLPAHRPVGKGVRGSHVIELRGGLVVPGTPGLAAVHA